MLMSQRFTVSVHKKEGRFSLRNRKVRDGSGLADWYFRTGGRPSVQGINAKERLKKRRYFHPKKTVIFP